MKTNLTKIMSVALLVVVTFMGVSCSNDDSIEQSTQTADVLIDAFTEVGIIVDGGLAEGHTLIYLTIEDESEAIEFLEAVVDGSFDTSGEMVILADRSSYVNIVKSSIDGVFYNVTFSLSGVDNFEFVLATEAYSNGINPSSIKYDPDLILGTIYY